MSHHLDSPIARQDIRLDITDLYVFRGETGTVFVINVCHSIAGPIPEPGYHPEGMYEFKIDLNGDAVEDITYRFKFDKRDAQGQQRYVAARITGADAVDPDAAGDVVAEGITGKTDHDRNRSAHLGRQSRRPVLDRARRAARGRPCVPGRHVDRSVRLGSQAGAKNLFAGHTVYSIVLEVPDAELLAGAADKRRIGVWAVATLATDAGGWRSINRVGLPMIHPLFTQYNEDLGNRLNAGRPADDFATYGAAVAKAIAGVVAANGTAARPEAYGETVAHRFFPNILPYEVGTPAVVWFRGMERPFPHGQRAQCHVLHSGKHARSPWHRQGVGHVEAISDIPVRSFRGLRARPAAMPAGPQP